MTLFLIGRFYAVGNPVEGELPSPLDPPPGVHPRCPLPFARCLEEPPLLKEVAPGRFAACHLDAAA